MAEKKKGDKKGKGKKESKEPPALQPTFKGHAGVVSAVCFANETLFTGGWDNAVKAWDLKTDEEKINFEGHTGGIMSLKFEAGLLWSASLDKSVRTWDSKSGVCRDVVKFPGSCLALDVDPNSFYVASDDVVYVANVKTKDVEAELRGHTNIIVCMKLHNGKLYTGSWDLTIRIWSPQRQCCERVLTGHTDYITSLCVQSHSLYSSALDSTVRIWDIEDGNCLTVIQCEEVPQCLAVEGNELLAGMQEGDVVMWDNRVRTRTRLRDTLDRTTYPFPPKNRLSQRNMYS